MNSLEILYKNRRGSEKDRRKYVKDNGEEEAPS